MLREAYDVEADPKVGWRRHDFDLLVWYLSLVGGGIGSGSLKAREIWDGPFRDLQTGAVQMEGCSPASWWWRVDELQPKSLISNLIIMFDRPLIFNDIQLSGV